MKIMQPKVNAVSWKSIKDELIEGNIFYAGKSYETIYSFQSNVPYATEVKFNTLGSDDAFKFRDTCQPHLLGGGSCEFTISFNPIEEGNKQLYLIVDVEDYEIPEARKDFTVKVEEPVIIDYQILEDLPLQTERGKSYAIKFQFSVISERKATGVMVIKKETASQDFQLTKVIEGITIDKTHVLVVEGIFIPSQIGENQKVGIVLSYQEGMDISVDSNPTKVVENITGKIRGSVTKDLSSQIKVGLSQPLEFTFYNEQTTPATDIQITISKDNL